MRLLCLPSAGWVLRALACLEEHTPGINDNGNGLRNRRDRTVLCACRGKLTDQAQNQPSRSKKKWGKDSRPRLNNLHINSPFWQRV